METIIGVPIPVLVKITYDRLKEAGGSLREAIDVALEPFATTKAKKWKLGYCRLAVLDGAISWCGASPHSDDDEDRIEESQSNIYASAAYFEDVEELTASPDAVLDESGRWLEPQTPAEAAAFYHGFDATFMKNTAPDTVGAVVY